MAEGAFEQARSALRAPDADASAAAAARAARLATPPGALGRVAALGVQLAGLAGTCPPPLPRPAALAVFAADHGVLAAGVTPWPQSLTARLVEALAGGGAAGAVLADTDAVRLLVVDVGLATDPAPSPRLTRRPVRRGTADLARAPAMARDDARAALDVGAEVAAELVADGARCLLMGEVGIGNTTSSAALVAACTGRPAAEVTGRGSGVDDATLARKVAAVEAGLARTGDAATDPLALLSSLGGLELAALAGYAVGGAAARVPVVADGLITLAALLVAARLAPGVEAWCVAGHRPDDPGAAAALDALGLAPLLDLGLRLGEGSGALLALPLLDAAARLLADTALLDEL